MALTLIPFNDQRLSRMTRASSQVRQQFKTIFDYSDVLKDPKFPIQGVAVTIADDGESITFAYRRVEIELVLTDALVDDAGAGKVTARLVSHPLISDAVELGSFKLNRSGETDLVPPQGGDERQVGSLTLQIVATLLEMAVYYDPAPAAPTVGIY